MRVILPSASDLPGLIPDLLEQRVVLDDHRVLNVRALRRFVSLTEFGLAALFDCSMFSPLFVGLPVVSELQSCQSFLQWTSRTKRTF